MANSALIVPQDGERETLLALGFTERQAAFLLWLVWLRERGAFGVYA